MADRNPILPPVSDSLVQFDPESLKQSDQDQQADIKNVDKQVTINKTSITNIVNGTTAIPVAPHEHNFDLLIAQDIPTGKWKTLTVPNQITSTNFVANATNYGVIFFAPLVIPKELAIDQIGIRSAVASATSVLRVGLYNEVNGRPDTLLLDAGTISVATPLGEKTVAASYTFDPGRYWAAAVWQTAQTTAAINGWSCFAGGSYHKYQDSISNSVSAGAGNPCFRTSANTYTTGGLPANTTNGTILAVDTSTNGLAYGPGLAFRAA